MDPATVQRTIEEALKQASQRGWEAVVLVIVMVGLISLTGFIVRWLIRSMDKRMEEALAREQRMAERLNALEKFAHEQLMAVIDRSAKQTQEMIDVVDSLRRTLDRRPCLLNDEEIKAKLRGPVQP